MFKRALTPPLLFSSSILYCYSMTSFVQIKAVNGQSILIRLGNQFKLYLEISLFLKDKI